MEGQAVGNKGKETGPGTSSTSRPWLLVASGAKRSWSKELAPVQGEEGEGHSFILYLGSIQISGQGSYLGK